MGTSTRTTVVRVIAVVVAMAGALSTTAAAAAAPDGPAPSGTMTASLTGWGRLVWFDPGDDLQFTVAAHATYTPSHPFPATSTGTARVVHRFNSQQPPVTVWADVTVDCLSTGRDTATVTGIVTDAHPLLADWRNHRVGFSVSEGRRGRPDHVGFSGPPDAGEPELRRCMAPAALFPVRDGGYTIRDANLIPGR
jgi:hypothetical protein